MYKVFVTAMKPGCTRNSQNDDRFRDFFRANRCELVDRAEAADIVVVSTCAYDSFMERISLRTIRELQACMQAGARLVVSGCLPGINPTALGEIFDGAVVGARSYEKLNELIDAQVPIEEIAEPIGVFRQYAIVSISSGCRSNCSFCAIRFAIGSTKSRAVGDIVADVREGLRRGHKKFLLNSDDSGAYGMDLGISVAELLEKVLAIPEDFQVYISTLNPQWLTRLFPKLERLLRSPKIEGMTSPVQSGSDRVLRRMRRWYTVEDYKRCIRTIRAGNPGMLIRSSIIAGFPGETEEDHAMNLDLVEAMAFDYAAIFSFSERPGTRITTELPRVPEDVIARRRAELEAAVEARSARWREAAPPRLVRA